MPFGTDGLLYPYGSVAEYAASNRARKLNPFLVAVWDGDVDRVRALIEEGEDVNLRNHSQQTALMIATIDGAQMVDILTESGADCLESRFEQTPSIQREVSKRRTLDVVTLLVESGADVNASDDNEKTPLMYAAANDSMAIDQFLVESGAEVNASDRSGKTSLMYAAENGSMDIVKFLVDRGANVNVSDICGKTSLMYAAENSSMEIVKFLVDRGADVNALDICGKTSLMYAAENSSMEIVKFLVDRGAYVNIPDDCGITSLMYAAENGSMEIVKFLVESGADVNVSGNDGETSLMHAAHHGSMEIVKLLVESGVDVNISDRNGKTSLMYAAHTGSMEIVKFLLDRGAEVNVSNNRGKTSLMCATENGSMETVKFLVESGTKVNVSDRLGKTSLMYATEKSSMEIVKFLVESGADINVSDNCRKPSLMYAAEKSSMEIVKFLVESGADINVSDNCRKTSLMYAAGKSSMEIVKLLVESGADVNISDNWGKTLLLYAAEKDRMETVKFLVESGADINVSDNCRKTSLIYAAEIGSMEMVKFLVDRGADVNISDKRGKTSLMYAAENGSMEIIKYLVKSGADVNGVGNDGFTKLAAAKNGWTSLMYATQRGDLVAVQFLLDNGADISVVNSDGRTAIFIASSQGYTDIQRLLMQNLPHDHQTIREPSTQMPDHCFISPFEVKLQQLMGSENVGGDYRALWLDAEVVVKVFVPGASATTFAHEAAIWHQLRHPNVIKLYGACDVGHHFFVCEWASNGSLVEYLAECKKRGEQGRPWKFLYEAALGLAYLHERKIIHGNLCNNSILVGDDGLVKLADFQVSGSTTASSGGRLDAGYGSYCWQAPERLKGEPISFASDIYSFCLCAMAVVTGEIPWNGCLNEYDRFDKDWWDRFHRPSDLTRNFPIDEPTDDLIELASKMCCRKPRARASASVVVRMLEHLAGQESKTQQCSTAKPELIEPISDYNGGELLHTWQKLCDAASTITDNQPELALFRELEALYKYISAEHRPIGLLKQFCELITDCIGAIDVGSHQYRILRLSSTNAQGRSMTGIYRRIDTIWAAIDDSHSTRKLKLSREELRQTQQNAFVSEVSQMLVVLDELDTDDARNAFFVAFLKKELDSYGSSYKPEQLKVLQKAYTDLNACIKSDAVTTMPKWFLPWYELEFDGANYLAEGGFGEVYRAKWLESEVVVKQVKLTNFNNSNSGAIHSLSASLPQETHSTKQNDKDKRKMFEHEVDVWFGLSHPHVVRLFGACHVGTPLFACEYASNGSLDEYLRKHPNEIWRKLYEAALGVQYLHSLDIIHGDLKCNNIVVGGDNKAKITDFGLSSANVVTGAWHWVAPECLDKEGSSQLSTASDVYAFGMCIVEALRIVEIITTKKEHCVYPWGNLNNIKVKYHVTRFEKLPSRPKLCTDHEWGLVERMCAFDRSKRLKISTVVSELGALAGVDTSQTPEMAETKSVKISKEEVDKMKSCCDFKAQDQREGSSSNQIVLCSVYGLLWDRFQDICGMDNVEFEHLQPLFERARVSTQKLEQCPNTLTGFTEMAMNGYALHREFDKVIDANFWCVNATDGELHDWKSKCKTIICNSELASPLQENDEQ